MAEPGLLLGLDAGNTVIKAVLFDRTGRQLAASQRNGASLAPAPGHVERDMEELWSNAAVVIRECLEKAGVGAAAVAAVGCAGHGNGLYLIDRGGRPLLAIQSLDMRAARLAEELRADGNGARLHAICLQEPWPSQTPTLLAWVRRHAPEVYAQCGTAFFCKDFVTFRLTGRRVSDISDMSGAGFVRLPDGAYDPGLLEGYGLADAIDLLPEILGPTDIAGGSPPRLRPPPGSPRARRWSPGSSTWWRAPSAQEPAPWARPRSSPAPGASTRSLPPRPSSTRASSWSRRSPRTGSWRSSSSATSAANLEWYVRELVERGAHHEDPFGACNRRVAEVTPSAQDPYFHPFLYGSREGAFMRAGFYGIAGWHGEGHLLRALFEGVAFEHRRHVDVLRSAGVRFDTATLSGGGARSQVWPQMFADVLGIPITVAACAETGALGAAIAAGVGAGVFPDLPAGVQAMTRRHAAFTPDPDMARHYSERYRTYRMLSEAMRPVWHRMAAAQAEA